MWLNEEHLFTVGLWLRGMWPVVTNGLVLKPSCLQILHQPIGVSEPGEIVQVRTPAISPTLNLESHHGF
jgi:hypothetical protein